MKKIVTAVIISSFLIGVGAVHATVKAETPAQVHLRQEYLAKLENARLDYLAAEKSERAELKAAQKKAKGKKAGALKKAAQKDFDAEMKKIRKKFIAAKKVAKDEFAVAKADSKKKSALSTSPAAEQPKEAAPQAVEPQAAASAPVAPAQALVTYSSAGFSPADVIVKAGTAVTFKNDADDRLWVASDPHPSHTIYPEFDQDAGVGKGGEYTFTFKKIGEWRYHNHLNPGKRGSVKVE